MPFNEDQSEELEVLNSIYPFEFERVTDDVFKLHLTPNPGGEDNHVAIALCCEFIEGYPADAPPLLTVEVEKGLGEAHSEEAKALADRVAAENVGMPLIFSVAEALKEWLVDNNVAGLDNSMYAEMMRRDQQKEMNARKQAEKAELAAAADNELKADHVDLDEMERIRKRQAGTPVTNDTFHAWKLKFMAEMNQQHFVIAGNSAAGSTSQVDSGKGLAKEFKISNVAASGSDRLTGKQWFMQKKAALEANFGDDGDDMADGVDVHYQRKQRGEDDDASDSSDDSDSDYIDEEGEEDDDNY